MMKVFSMAWSFVKRHPRFVGSAVIGTVALTVYGVADKDEKKNIHETVRSMFSSLVNGAKEFLIAAVDKGISYKEIQIGGSANKSEHAHQQPDSENIDTQQAKSLPEETDNASN